MAGPGLRGFIKVGVDILTTTVDKATGKILAQIGSVVEQTTDQSNVEWWQPSGWASRPSKPDAKKAAAQGTVIASGDYDVCIASQDVRCLDIYGNLNFGEFCAFASGSDAKAQGRVIGKGDGTVTMFTTSDNTKAGKSVYFRVAPDGFIWTAPWGTMRFDAMGFHMIHASGACINSGGVGGLPAPLDIVGSYIKLQASNVSASSIGAPLADALSTITAIAALQTQMIAIAAAFTKLAAAVGPLQSTDAVAAAAIVIPAVAVGGTTVGVQSALIPKGSGMT